MTASLTPFHHPDCHSLIRYAAGHLSPGMRLLIASHLELCQRCRLELQAYEAEAGLGLELLQPEDMDISCLENLLHKIDEYGPPACIDVTIPIPQKNDHRLPQAVQIVAGGSGEKISWQCSAAVDHGAVSNMKQIHFLQIHAASHNAAPEHISTLLVLDGTLLIEDHAYQRGDVVEVHSTHTLNAQAQTEALCLVVTPLKDDKPTLLQRIFSLFRN